MSRVTSQLSVSLDGYAAGPHQTMTDPLGQGGMRLHEWVIATAAWNEQQGHPGGEPGPDSDVAAGLFTGVGAYIMGRNMFGADRGDWDPHWRGWWGDNPPYHLPVFVLAHRPREQLTMDGGTTFTFVTDGIESALGQARAAAGEGDVHIAGGASTVRQYLAAGLLDELYLHIAPIVLGAGERLLVDVGDPVLEPVEVVASPVVTHVRYRVRH